MIVIATPSNELVWARFCVSMANLMRRHPDAQFVNPRATCTTKGRNDALRLVRRSEASHVLWIDADMEFPPDTLQRLLAHDVPIVGATYALRQPPHGKAHAELDEPDLSPLAQVKALPGGMLLVRSEVYEKTGEFLYHGTVTNDYAWSTTARQAGFRLMLDRTLRVGHVSCSVVHLPESA